MSPEMTDRVSWSSRVVRHMGLGEVLMSIDGSRMRFMIRKNGIITHSFKSLDQFERFATTTMDRRSSNMRIRVRSTHSSYVSRAL